MPGIRIHQTAAGDRATFKGTDVGPWLSLASSFLESLRTHEETEGQGQRGDEACREM